MLKLAELAAFLTSGVRGTAGVSCPVGLNRMPDSPDVIVVAGIVPGHGGHGLTVDGAFQELVVHVRSRAATDAAAETLALQVDDLLMNHLPVTMGATFVRQVLPVGGPPAYLERDPGNRTSYFCDYLMEVSR